MPDSNFSNALYSASVILAKDQVTRNENEKLIPNYQSATSTPKNIKNENHCTPAQVHKSLKLPLQDVDSGEKSHE
jgi:hypothetical protein